MDQNWTKLGSQTNSQGTSLEGRLSVVSWNSRADDFVVMVVEEDKMGGGGSGG